MTTELSAAPILDDTPIETPRPGTPSNHLENSTSHHNDSNYESAIVDDDNEIPLTQYKSSSTSVPNLHLSPTPSSSSSSARIAATRGRHISIDRVSSIPRPLLVKARTTGDYLQHIHDQSHREFLIANGGPLAARKFSLSTDYGLDELRAPPILSDRPRRKSLESAWTSKPILPQKTRRERLTDDLIVGSWIAFLAIWGALARIGLNALTTYPGQIVFPLIWSQFTGCGVMGFLLQDKTLFPKETRYVALYIGLTTGFCGSLTSFSSFIWNCFQALADLDPYYPRDRGYNFIALCGQVIITLCISIAGLRFGAHIAQVMRHILPSVIQIPQGRRGLDLLGIALGTVGWAAAGIMCGLIPKWRAQLFTAVLAPAGALCRWQLSRFNPRIPSFPLGTFAANILAIITLGTMNLIQGRIRAPLSFLDCTVLYGIDNGFCGCLSTVSTFAVELDTLVRKHAYIYASVSIILGIVLLVLVVGVLSWTVGYESMCGL